MAAVAPNPRLSSRDHTAGAAGGLQAHICRQAAQRPDPSTHTLSPASPHSRSLGAMRGAARGGGRKGGGGKGVTTRAATRPGSSWWGRAGWCCEPPAASALAR